MSLISYKGAQDKLISVIAVKNKGFCFVANVIVLCCSIVDQTPLLFGREMQYMENGKPYFVDHNSRKTIFGDPRKLG